MRYLILAGRWTAAGAMCALLLTFAATAAAQPGRRHHGADGRIVRAALPPGAVRHIFVIELENESEAGTFGPTSPATYLNDTLLKDGELRRALLRHRPRQPRQLHRPDLGPGPHRGDQRRLSRALHQHQHADRVL